MTESLQLLWAALSRPKVYQAMTFDSVMVSHYYARHINTSGEQRLQETI